MHPRDGKDIMDSELLDTGMDNHSDQALSNHEHNACCGMQSPGPPPHHKGLDSTSLHVMPSNSHLRAGIEVKTTSPKTNPRG